MFSLNRVDDPMFSLLLSTLIFCAYQVEWIILREGYNKEEKKGGGAFQFGLRFPTFLKGPAKLCQGLLIFI